MDKRVLARFGREPAEAKAILERELAAFVELPDEFADVWTLPVRSGAWSPAQVTDHVRLINVSISKVLHLLRRKGPLPDAPRVPATVVEGWVQAPSFALPGPSQPWAVLEGPWLEMATRLKGEVAATHDWHGRTWFHPFFGDLDALEWVASASLHMAHHRKQLRENDK